MVKELNKFIKDNNLEFHSGSGGDNNILALCGYATFIGASVGECKKVAKNEDCNDEIERIYDYADKHNYKAFWSTEKAKSQYKF